jgi:hypothetical protein
VHGVLFRLFEFSGNYSAKTRYCVSNLNSNSEAEMESAERNFDSNLGGSEPFILTNKIMLS